MKKQKQTLFQELMTYAIFMGWLATCLALIHNGIPVRADEPVPPPKKDNTEIIWNRGEKIDGVWVIVQENKSKKEIKKKEKKL